MGQTCTCTKAPGPGCSPLGQGIAHTEMSNDAFPQLCTHYNQAYAEVSGGSDPLGCAMAASDTDLYDPLGSCGVVHPRSDSLKAARNQMLLNAVRDRSLERLQQALKAAPYIETRKPMGMVKMPSPFSPRDELGVQKAQRNRGNCCATVEGLTPLMLAAHDGWYLGARILLDANADPNATEEDGLRPLHLAASVGEFQLCSLLLAFGAERGALDVDGRTALECVPTETAADRDWEALLGGSQVSMPEVHEACPVSAPQDTVKDEPLLVLEAT